ASRSESANFGHGARHERGFGAVAEGHAVTDSGGNGNDVFERAAQLDAFDVGAGVNPKLRRGENSLHLGGDGFRITCRYAGSANPTGNLCREAWPRERGMLGAR